MQLHASGTSAFDAENRIKEKIWKTIKDNVNIPAVNVRVRRANIAANNAEMPAKAAAPVNACADIQTAEAEVVEYDPGR